MIRAKPKSEKREYLFVDMGKGKNKMSLTKINGEYWIAPGAHVSWIALMMQPMIKIFPGDKRRFVEASLLMKDCPSIAPWAKKMIEEYRKVEK